MSTGHSHTLHLERASPVHRLAPEVKIVASVAYTVLVAVTPRHAFGAFAAYAALLAGVAIAARVPPGWLAKRSLIEVPFVALALLLPLLGGGEQVRWLGMSLSVDGLLGAWNIFAKGTLGVLASLLLAATTPVRDLVTGLERLRCPRILTQIATFMLRYVDLLGEEARRMRIARLSRGYEPRFLWQVRAFASGLGSLFLRAFERGERVYLAMLSRGYSGTMPRLTGGGATGAEWAGGLALPVATAAVLLVVVLR